MLAVCLVVSSCTGAETGVQRPLAGRENLVVESAQVGAVTRPVLHIAGNDQSTRKLILGRLPAGELRTFLALDSASAGFALAELRLQGQGMVARILADKPQVCRQTWNTTSEISVPAPVVWHECRLRIPRDYPSAELTIRLEATAQAGLMLSSPVVVPARPSMRPPVFVLLIDTVRLDVLRSFDRSRETGRHLDRLARDSIVFDGLRAPSSWTRSSVASLLSGVSPARHKVYDRLDVLGDDLETLPSYLQSVGYYTSAWSTNPNILPMWGFARGFDEFVDVGANEWAKDKADSNEVFTLVEKAVLADIDLPHLFYIHLMDAHSPYTPPAELLQAVKTGESMVKHFPVAIGRPDVAEVWFAYQRYVAEVRDLDEQIGAFLEFLKGAGLYDSSLILVVADHGEEFLDHYGTYHGQTLYDEVLRVPAFLKLPAQRLAGTHLTGATELTDFFPTIVEALGLPVPEGLEGRDVLEFSDQPRPQVAELILDGHRLGSVAFEDWKLIVDHKSGQVRLYDLREDPRESVDRAAKQPERARALRRMLDALTARHSPGWHLRACGCGEPSSLHLSLTARGGRLRSVSLEDDDHVKASGDDIYLLDLELNPTLAKREVLGALIKVTVFDEDEIVVEPEVRVAGTGRGTDGEGLKVSVAAPLEYALGAGGVEQTSTELVLDSLHERARVAGSRPIDCRSGTPTKKKEKVAVCKPFVRIWYVDSPEPLPAAAVGPAVAERLRALGYVW